jgi:lipid-binding SYLF domain-containing protein
MTRSLPGCLVLAAALPSPAPALPPHPARTLEHATEVLDDLAAIPLKGIPPALLADAHGVAIIPRVVKAGFVFGGRGGHGVVLTRGKDGAWSDPVFVNLGGASVGFQAGVESTDVVLVFRSAKSLERLFEGKGKVTLGADAGVAAGPVGRQAMAATDGKLEAEILSYSRSRGLFAGVSLDGAVIRPEPKANAPLGPVEQKLADGLKAKLHVLGGAKPEAVAPPVLSPPVPPAAMPARP